MTYRVERDGYAWLQRSYREGGHVKTEIVEWYGRIDGGKERKKRKGLTAKLNELSETLKDMVRKDYLTEEVMQAEIERRDAQNAKHERINELLTGETISLEGLQEVVDLQTPADVPVQSEPESAVPIPAHPTSQAAGVLPRR